MAIEIERKFLVAGDFTPFVEQAERIVQGYLCSAPDKTVRVRVRGDKGFLTIKGLSDKSGIARSEFEYEIPLTDAEALLLLCESGVIDKIRHLVPFRGHTWEVDVFHGCNEGLVVAEIELREEDETFEHPDWIGEEVTGQGHYYNSMLSKHPYIEWGLDKKFDIINIETDRLIIRPVRLGDEDAIYSYRSDSVVNKYQGWFPNSAKEIRDHIENCISQNIDVADLWFQFAIVLKDENKLIGDIGLHFTEYNKMQVELGCTLCVECQGKGFASEALRSVVDHLFIVLKKHRVFASIDPRNRQSIKMVERLGFRKEAYLKESLFHRGEWADDLIYGILKDEWK